MFMVRSSVLPLLIPMETTLAESSFCFTKVTAFIFFNLLAACP
jgi:hypothetical protein